MHGFGQRIDRGLLVAELGIQSGQFHPRIGQRRRLSGPVLDQGECLGAVVFFDLQDGQAPVTVAMIRITFQALQVTRLRLFQAGGLIRAESAKAMIGRTEIVIAVGVVGSA